MKFLRDSAFTGGVSDPEASDIDRRAQDVVKFGVVKEADYKRSPPSYRVGIGDEADEDNYILTDWLPAGGMRAKGDRETHFLEVGEKVVLLAEGGELATAQVMPAGTYTPDNEDERQTADKPGVWNKTFKDGGLISYDRDTHLWTIDGTDKGEMVLKAGGCEIHMKEGTITLKAKNVTVEADDKIETQARESNHTVIDAFRTVGWTWLGLKRKTDKPMFKVLTDAAPARKTFANVFDD